MGAQIGVLRCAVPVQAQLIGRLFVNHSSLFGPTLLLLSSTRGARVIHTWLEPVDH